MLETRPSLIGGEGGVAPLPRLRYRSVNIQKPLMFQRRFSIFSRQLCGADLCAGSHNCSDWTVNGCSRTPEINRGELGNDLEADDRV